MSLGGTEKSVQTHLSLILSKEIYQITIISTLD